MKFRPLLVPAIILTASGGLVGWLLLAEPPAPRDGVAASGGAWTSSSHANSGGTAGAPVPQDPVTAPLPEEIRDVSPEGVSAPKVDGGLKRVEPSKRYLELKDPPVEPIPDGPIELRRVQVPDGGHIRSDRLTVTLAHIKPLKPDETCLSRLGGTWPCGARARTFLRGLVRQFKITCEKIEETGPQQVLATCMRGTFDLSRRLVRYGWADPAVNAPDEIVDLARMAQDKKIGKWQSEWLNDLPEPHWDDGTGDALPELEALVPEIVDWSQKTETLQTEQQPVDAGTAFPAQ